MSGNTLWKLCGEDEKVLRTFTTLSIFSCGSWCPGKIHAHTHTIAEKGRKGEMRMNFRAKMKPCRSRRCRAKVRQSCTRSVKKRLILSDDDKVGKHETGGWKNPLKIYALHLNTSCGARRNLKALYFYSYKRTNNFIFKSLESTGEIVKILYCDITDLTNLKL